MALPKSLLRRHVLAACGLVALCRIASIHTADAPKAVYHCPLDRHGLTDLWTDENCYWSASYAEAREKFVSLGNRLKEQVLLAASGDDLDALDVVDVRSLSYDIARDYPEHLRTMETSDVDSPQTILPGTDTIDALLLTLRIPETSETDRKERVNVIHSSGTHGVEGYLGSAVQCRFLHELFLRNEERLAEKPRAPSPSLGDGGTRRVLLIHAVNPYGMRHHRRTNENNVDLNRNVLSANMWNNVRRRDPNFVGYVDLDSALNPFAPFDADGELFSWADAARRGGFGGDATRLQEQDERVKNAADEENKGSPQKPSTTSVSLDDQPPSAISSWLEEQIAVLGTFRTVVAAIATRGYTNAKRTMVASQYHKPSGIFYGGGAHNDNKWENSIFAVQHAIKEFAGFQFDSPSSRALFIDVHTGLGKWGEYSILTKDPGSGDLPSSRDEAVSDGARRGKLGEATSPHASDADCARNLDVQPFDDSPVITFEPDARACKTGKVYVGASVDDGNVRITLVPGRTKGTFTASVNDNATGDIYTISPNADGVMMTVKRNQQDYEPEEPPLPPPPDDGAWTSKLISLLEESGMGCGKTGDASVSDGYDKSVGFLNDRVLCPPPRCFPLTQEFGTRPGVGVAVALILENGGHNAREGRRRGHLTSWAFNPRRLSWRRKALRGGADLLRAALDF